MRRWETCQVPPSVFHTDLANDRWDSQGTREADRGERGNAGSSTADAAERGHCRISRRTSSRRSPTRDRRQTLLADLDQLSAAWYVTEPQRSASYVPGHLGSDFKDVPLMLDSQVAGLQGDWTRLDQVLRDMRTEMGEDNRRVQSIVAFWGSVRGHYADAAKALALAEPIPNIRPPVLGAMPTRVSWRQRRFASIAAPAAPRSAVRARTARSTARRMA